MMQRLGERIVDEETHEVKQMDAEQTEGKKVAPVLFEEMDGVWLHIQDAYISEDIKKNQCKRSTERYPKLI